MNIQCLQALAPSESYEMIVLPFWEGGGSAYEHSQWRAIYSRALESGDFKAKLGETLVLYAEGRVVLLGLGKQESVSAESIRRAYSCAVRIAQAKKVESLHVALPQTSALNRSELLAALGDGIFLTNYAFTHLKEDTLKDNPVVLLKRVAFLDCSADEEPILQKQLTIAAGVYLVRELVNGNADEVTPQLLAETAWSLEKRTKGLKATVLEKKQILKEKMGLFLAVNRGSPLDPCLIQLSYRGNPKSEEHIVLIGKGVTYDTGGLSLKPTEGMLTMKCDMAGAATVLAAVQTAAALQLKVNVTALAPASENSIDGQSYKVGDVYRSMSGKTVEITNTDAEGRLLLADAITYALTHLNPTLMVDLATLTGGIVVALGEEISGLFSNDEALADALLCSSKTTGEQLWRMPLYPDYKELLKSEVADLVNSAGRSASSMTAALFLQEFVGSVPWAHIDFAGAAFLSKPKYYNPTKATGCGVRLLIDFLERRFR